MSRAGRLAAEAYGQALPQFASVEEATRVLMAKKAETLEYLQRQYCGTLDFSPESLKTIEAWYFTHFASGEDKSGELERVAIEEALAVYFGEVVVRTNSRFEWAVKPYVYTPGRYELTVSTSFIQLGVTRVTDLYARRNNARRQSIYRDFKQYAA